MDFIIALGIMILSIIICLISTIITLIVGIALANYIGLTGQVWWAFIILFWLVITSILNNKTRQ